MNEVILGEFSNENFLGTVEAMLNGAPSSFFIGKSNSYSLNSFTFSMHNFIRGFFFKFDLSPLVMIASILHFMVINIKWVFTFKRHHLNSGSDSQFHPNGPWLLLQDYRTFRRFMDFLRRHFKILLKTFYTGL